ncbi:hypothetical protein INR49_004402 [Caranx melampygus]|nr:hypothetical protein INR49_004402 [Caranx melampygus]
MPHAPTLSSANCAKMQTKLSAWTPLNHPVANSKVFEERRTLLAKWFDRWSDRQRRAVLQDLVLSCSVEQLRFLSVSVSRQLPLQAADFTCLLPRALCLYLFSFLDPRSLCRCAQVYTKSELALEGIVELDQLWMPKCLRLGWCISFSPTILEQGVWKRHYIQTVQELRLSPRQAVSSLQHVVTPDVTVISSRCDDLLEPAVLTEERPASAAQQVGNSLRTGFMREKQPTALPPWRDADRHPRDTRRFNYLDNLDPIQQALRGKVSSTAAALHSGAPTPDDGGRKTLSEANYKLRKAKSLVKPRSIHHRHYPTVTVTSLPESKGGGKRGGLPGDCATSRHHALWSSVYTGLHVNDEGLREGGDRGKPNYADDGMFLSSNCRPQHPPLHHHHHHYHHTQSQTQWASHSNDCPVTKETAKSLLRLAQWNAGIRPGPVRSAVPRLSVEALKASQRSQRSSPSTPLFGVQPWIVPAPHGR